MRLVSRNPEHTVKYFIYASLLCVIPAVGNLRPCATLSKKGCEGVWIGTNNDDKKCEDVILFVTINNFQIKLAQPLPSQNRAFLSPSEMIATVLP